MKSAQAERSVTFHLLAQLIVFEQEIEIPCIHAGYDIVPSLVYPVVQIAVEKDSLVVKDCRTITTVHVSLFGISRSEDGLFLQYSCHISVSSYLVALPRCQVHIDKAYRAVVDCHPCNHGPLLSAINNWNFAMIALLC